MKNIKINKEQTIEDTKGNKFILEKGDEIQVLNEKISYPSQADAELLVEWANATSGIYVGGASNELRNALAKADQIRMIYWDKVFGESSPWSVRLGRKGKGEFYWDDEKASRLGL